jgi:hypothetical protein
MAGESRRSRPGYAANGGVRNHWERLPNQRKPVSRNVLCLCLSALRFPPSRTLSPRLRCGARAPMLTEVEITLLGKFGR